jgi:integrase
LAGCDACGTRKGIAYRGVDGKKQGLLVHDLRRSAAKAMRLAGVSESTVMRIGGWRTASMFRRHAIDSHKDQQQAVDLRKAARAKQAAQAQAAQQAKLETAPITAPIAR